MGFDDSMDYERRSVVAQMLPNGGLTRLRRKGRFAPEPTSGFSSADLPLAQNLIHAPEPPPPEVPLVIPTAPSKQRMFIPSEALAKARAVQEPKEEPTEEPKNEPKDEPKEAPREPKKRRSEQAPAATPKSHPVAPTPLAPSLLLPPPPDPSGPPPASPAPAPPPSGSWNQRRMDRFNRAKAAWEAAGKPCDFKTWRESTGM